MKIVSNGKTMEVSGGGQAQDIYSLEEQVVGRWIDGKPIYQRVLQVTTFSTGEHGSRAIYTMPEPIDTWIQLTAILNEHGQWSPFPYVYPYADTTTGLIPNLFFIFGRDNTYETEPNTVRMIITNRFINLPAIVFLRYTKVADVATIELPVVLTAEPAQALSVQNYTSVASTASANFDQSEEI